MLDTVKKIVISSKENLKAKYGKDFKQVEALLNSLVEADAQRGLDTSIVYIDDATSVKKAGIKKVAVTSPACKKAIDELYNLHTPAYLVIFGSKDIIPHQELMNSVPYHLDMDADKVVPSDLPYACDAPYNKNIGAFTGPSRVVGRIPDITGQGDLEYVTAVVEAIIKYQPRDEEIYLPYFSVAAATWKKSTRKSLTNIVGNSTTLKLAPPATSPYTKSALKARTHFYNCHGAPADSRFYGEDDYSMPEAIVSTDLENKISAGTIVAAECCYGAELFDPQDEDFNQLPIVNTYLKNKALAFLGSSTIAYGPADGQGLADLITQYFIKNVLRGASTGRALLEARQKFLAVSNTLDPYEMKTLAQFDVLGDPSVQPVFKEEIQGEESIGNRRLKLNVTGNNLAKSISICLRAKELPKAKAKNIKFKTKNFKNIFEKAGFTGNENEFIYVVKSKNKVASNSKKRLTGNEDVVFRALVQTPEKNKKNSKVNAFKVLIIKESAEELLGWKVYHRK